MRAALVLACVLVARSSSAGPSLWDRARDPSLKQAEEALTLAIRARTPGDIPLEALPAFDSLLSLRAATALELSGGARIRNPEIWFFLGSSLVTANRGRDHEARALLARAIRERPSAPEVAGAWFDIAIASNRLRDFRAERAAYTEALRLQWDRDRRAGIHLNRGESQMSLRDLAAAREDYLTAIALSSDAELSALAHWGLGVALARDDDMPEALEHAFEASRVQFRGPDGSPVVALDLPGVFFTPDYEIHYYRGLGDMALGTRTDEPKARHAALTEAVRSFERYVAGARPVSDPWIRNVESLIQTCERRMRAPSR